MVVSLEKADHEAKAEPARILMNLNKHNSPDLDDEQRNKLKKDAREAMVVSLKKADHEAKAEPARILMNLNKHNSPDLDDEQRNKLKRKAREAMVESLEEADYGNKAGPARILMNLNKHNSPDLNQEQRNQLKKEAQEAMVESLKEADYGDDARPAELLLSPTNMINDLIEGLVMISDDLLNTKSNIESIRSNLNDEFIPGLPNELLVVGTMLNAMDEFDNFLEILEARQEALGDEIDPLGDLMNSDGFGLEFRMAASSLEINPSQVGGIDLNPKGLNLKEAGHSINFNFPEINITVEQSQMIKGVQPVIVNILILPNLFPLLGMNSPPLLLK